MQNNKIVNPWTLKSSQQMYDNPWITVEHHDVITPLGGVGIYGKVHFKNFALGIIPLDEYNNTWIVGQYRYPLDAYSWEIPMGGGTRDCDPLESAQRELLEETGLTALQWNLLMKLHTSNSVTDETALVYVARQVQQGKPQFDETEDIAIKKIPFSELYQMVIQGSITDAISVAGVLRLAAQWQSF